MLTLLRISGFALIDELELPLGPGLTVITGETGAGKSILVDALGLVRGGRASSDVIRAGAEEARVEAVFELDPADARLLPLRAQGRLAEGDGSLIVRRHLSAGGRGRIYLGGSLATLAELAAGVGGLVDITSQHDQQSLMDPDSQRAILDGFAENQTHLRDMKAAHEVLVAARRERDAFDADTRGRAEREDFLRFQGRELADANLQPGEDEALRQERALGKDAEKIAAAVALGEEALYAGESAAATRLASVVQAIAPFAALDGAIAGMRDRLQEARALVEDAARELARWGAQRKASFDPDRLAAIEDRLFLVGRLVRKHGGSIEAALAERDRIAQELRDLGDFEGSLRQKTDAVEKAEARAQAVAGELSERRRRAAGLLARAIDETLRDLGLGGARIDIEAEPLPPAEIGPSGRDRVRFLFTPNPGEPTAPLARIASGGELSRVMLAVKRALANADRAALSVFDEVDAGVGGAVAEVIGRKLAGIAERRQVLVVTHMPQIAAFADRHLKVEKGVRAGRTVVSVTALDAGARRDEIARMLGGADPSREALAHADEMLGRSAARGRAPGRGRSTRTASVAVRKRKNA